MAVCWRTAMEVLCCLLFASLCGSIRLEQEAMEAVSDDANEETETENETETEDTPVTANHHIISTQHVYTHAVENDEVDDITVNTENKQQKRCEEAVSGSAFTEPKWHSRKCTCPKGMMVQCYVGANKTEKEPCWKYGFKFNHASFKKKQCKCELCKGECQEKVTGASRRQVKHKVANRHKQCKCPVGESIQGDDPICVKSRVDNAKMRYFWPKNLEGKNCFCSDGRVTTAAPILIVEPVIQTMEANEDPAGSDWTRFYRPAATALGVLLLGSCLGLVFCYKWETTDADAWEPTAASAQHVEQRRQTNEEVDSRMSS